MLFAFFTFMTKTGVGLRKTGIIFNGVVCKSALAALEKLRLEQLTHENNKLTRDSSKEHYSHSIC